MKFFTHFWNRFRDLYAYRHEPEYAATLARMYWYAILITVIIMLISSFTVAELLFAYVHQSADDTLAIPHGNAAGFNQKQLQSALDAFAARRAEYESLKGQAPTLADPSK